MPWKFRPRRPPRRGQSPQRPQQPQIWNAQFYDEYEKSSREWAKRFARWMANLPPEKRYELLSRPFEGARLAYLYAQSRGQPISEYQSLVEQAKAHYRWLRRYVDRYAHLKHPYSVRRYQFPSEDEFLRRTLGGVRRRQKPYRHVPNYRLTALQRAMRNADRVIAEYDAKHGPKSVEEINALLDRQRRRMSAYEREMWSDNDQPIEVTPAQAQGGVSGPGHVIDSPVFTRPIKTKRLDTALAILKDPIVRARYEKMIRAEGPKKTPKQVGRDWGRKQQEPKWQEGAMSRNWSLITRGRGGFIPKRPSGPL